MAFFFWLFFFFFPRLLEGQLQRCCGSSRSDAPRSSTSGGTDSGAAPATDGSHPAATAGPLRSAAPGPAAFAGAKLAGASSKARQIAATLKAPPPRSASPSTSE